jgi:hypothetical protein
VILVSVHPESLGGHKRVSDAEMSNFPQVQGNQGIARRRTHEILGKSEYRNPKQFRNPNAQMSQTSDLPSFFVLNFVLGKFEFV